jgi:hypothetical protein
MSKLARHSHNSPFEALACGIPPDLRAWNEAESLFSPAKIFSLRAMATK